MSVAFKPAWQVRRAVTASLRVLGSVVFVGAAWGTMYGLYGLGLRDAGPLSLACLRFVAFAVGAFVVLLIGRRRLEPPRSPREILAVLAYAGFNVVLHNLGTIGGAAHVPAAVIGIAAGCNPIFTAALARLAWGRSAATWRTHMGLWTGLAGVGLLTVSRSGGGFEVSGWTVVVVAGIAAWSVGTVVLKALDPVASALSIGFWGSLVSVPAFASAALALEPWPRLTWSLGFVALFAGWVGGLAAFLVWMRLVRAHGPTHANLVSYVAPVASAVVGYTVLSQPFDPTHAFAYVLVAAGLGCVLMDAQRAARTVPTTAVQ